MLTRVALGHARLAGALDFLRSPLLLATRLWVSWQFLVSGWLGSIIFLAIVLHKIPEGFTVASLMLASGQSRRIGLYASIWLGVATVAGVLLMGILHTQIGYALPISAGVTLYVAATDLVPEVNREPDARMALLVFTGVGLMLLLDKLFRF